MYSKISIFHFYNIITITNTDTTFPFLSTGKKQYINHSQADIIGHLLISYIFSVNTYKIHNWFMQVPTFVRLIVYTYKSQYWTVNIFFLNSAEMSTFFVCPCQCPDIWLFSQDKLSKGSKLPHNPERFS